MLKYNFEKIFKARAIHKPFALLKKAGFSSNFASKIKNSDVTRLEPKHIEKLCILFKCTPNDLMEWIPDNETDYNDLPLSQLKRSVNEVDMIKTIHNIPLGKLNDIKKLIDKELENQ